jgi:hypothetical protein
LWKKLKVSKITVLLLTHLLYFPSVSLGIIQVGLAALVPPMPRSVENLHTSVRRHLAWQHIRENMHPGSTLSLPTEHFFAQAGKAKFVESLGDRMGVDIPGITVPALQLEDGVALVTCVEEDDADFAIEEDGESIDQARRSEQTTLIIAQGSNHVIDASADTIVFRVVKTNPSALHCVRGVPARVVRPGDIAITVHRYSANFEQEDCALTLESNPAVLDSELRLHADNCILFMRAGWPIPLDVMVEELLQWEISSKMEYAMDHLVGPHLLFRD